MAEPRQRGQPMTIAIYLASTHGQAGNVCEFLARIFRDLGAETVLMETSS